MQVTEIYALQTATMIGCALEGTAEWFIELHTNHATEASALTTMVAELNAARDKDLALMQSEYPQDQYCEDDYAIRLHTVKGNSSFHELVRRNGTEMIPLTQMVITKT